MAFLFFKHICYYIVMTKQIKSHANLTSFLGGGKEIFDMR